MIRASIGNLPIPLRWLEVLYKVQQVFPPAVMAGGCLRDLWNNLQPKDVDIFVPVKNEVYALPDGFDIEECPIKAYEEELLALFPDAVLVAQNMYGRGNAELERTIFSVWHIQVHGIEYDVIFIADTVDITTFDINICQIACDGTDLLYTDAFVNGVAKKELRVMNINRTDRNMKRIERMKLKYPTWSVADGELGN